MLLVFFFYFFRLGPLALCKLPYSLTNNILLFHFRGRGRGNVLPSWMTSNDQLPAPGSGAPTGVGGDSLGPIQSVEDALAVLEAYGVKHAKKDKKHRSKDKKKSSKHRREKKDRQGSKDRHRHRHKKRRHRHQSSGSSSSSDSDSR